MQILSPSVDLKKSKNHVLIFSGVSLFISLTESLPQKIAIIGLDLSDENTVVGWFLLIITIYFLLRFIIYSVIELIKFYLPTFIGKKTSNTTGDTIGLTASECFPDQNYEPSDIGTPSGEMDEIRKKNEMITYHYKSKFIKISNAFNVTFEIILPIIFSITSLIYLYGFLSGLD